MVVSGVREELMNYEYLLERLYKKVPPKSGEATYEIPEPVVIRIGSQTVIRNFREIAERLNRDPQLLARFLQKELATGGSYDSGSGQLVLNIKVSRRVIKQFLDLFLNTYVRCPTCGSYHTRLEKRGRTWVLVCLACGAEQPVSPI